jgi:hypothetical protein
MDKWIEEYRDFLKTNRDWYINANANKDKADSYTFAIEWFDRILARNGQNDQPAPPAESLHDAAKRWLADNKTDCYTNRLYERLAEAPQADFAIDRLRKWAAENPPKAALTGVCALCSNAEVGCGNCKHNPRHVDHFHKAEGV